MFSENGKQYGYLQDELLKLAKIEFKIAETKMIRDSIHIFFGSLLSRTGRGSPRRAARGPAAARGGRGGLRPPAGPGGAPLACAFVSRTHVLHVKFAGPEAGTLRKARPRLCRRRFLQVNTRSKRRLRTRDMERDSFESA